MGDSPDFLVDKSEYVLGALPKDGGDIDAKKAVRVKKRRELFARAVADANAETREAKLTAVLSFLDATAERQRCIGRLNEARFGSNDLICFEVAGESVHESASVRAYFSRTRRSEDTSTSQCLVCGGQRTPVDKHSSLQLRGGTSSGVALVSFNADAFESYGWERNENAPVCQACADAYTTGLRRLLSDRYPDPEHPGETLHKRFVGLSNDTTAVFWADKDDRLLDLFAGLFNEADPEAVATLLTSPFTGGRPVGDMNRFFCMVLSGGQGRATVRSMRTGFLPEVERNVQRYFRTAASLSDKPIGLYFLLRSLAVQNKADNLSPNLAGELFIAILFGRRFPRAVLSAACARCRAEQKVTIQRAILLSAYFQSQRTESEVCVGLNAEEINPGYRLGRLLAVLERLQSEAQGSTNKTIVDRYYGSASTRPGTVFPTLLGLSMHHVAKLKSPGYYQKQLGEVLDGLRHSQRP